MSETVELHAGTECANHPGLGSEAVCSVCGKPVCADCFVQFGDTIVCDDPEHKAMLEKWVIVFRSNSEFEADMIVRNLEHEGLELRRYSSRSYKQMIGEDPSDFVNVFALQSDRYRALQILTDLGLPGVNQINQESH